MRLPLHTARLFLRRYLPADGEGLSDCLSDPETLRFTAYPALGREAAAEEAAARAENADFTAVCLPPAAAYPDGRFIGSVFLSPCGFSGAELAYLISPLYRRRGYAEEACRAVLGAAFAEGCHRVTALCDTENEASRRLLARLGMRCEGVMRQNLWFHTDACGNPLWRDTALYAVLAEEFSSGGAATFPV